MNLKPSLTLLALAVAGPALAYPPGVGILTPKRNCAACHPANGPWADESKTIIDVLDAETKKSLKAPGGEFVIEVQRNQARTVLTVIGRVKGEAKPPRRNGWLYIDPKQIDVPTLSKFAPGWDVNLPASCRVVGDKVEAWPDAALTTLPMTIRPSDAARDADLELHFMLSSGESVKGKPEQGIVSNSGVRKVVLKVLDKPAGQLPTPGPK